MPTVFAGALVVMAAGTSCGSGCSAIASVVAADTVADSGAAVPVTSGLEGAEAETACRFGLRSGSGTAASCSTMVLAGFATLVLAGFEDLAAFTGLATLPARDFEACCLAAIAPVAM